MSKDLLDNCFASIKAVHDYFGYVEQYKVLSIEDSRDVYWTLYQDERGRGSVRFADWACDLEDEGDHWENDIYTQRHLPKHVYRTDEYTMICVETNQDAGNQYLQIFDNQLEIKNV